MISPSTDRHHFPPGLLLAAAGRPIVRGWDYYGVVASLNTVVWYGPDGDIVGVHQCDGAAEGWEVVRNSKGGCGDC